jgi:uncharacterized peroxidase-related enzyme
MWIQYIPYIKSEGQLRALYDRVKGPSDNVDNIMLAHSLRPHTMEGHMALYKATLHHTANTIDRWFLEALGVYTSHLNGCAYCVEHHFVGMKRLLKNDRRAGEIRKAFEDGSIPSVFSTKEIVTLEYAEALTKRPGSVSESDVTAMREAGWSDDQVLEINQVVAYFNYANRTVLGLGVRSDGDILGLSPNATGNPDDWSHRPVSA